MTSPSRGDSPFLAAAVAYAARGWPVFPLVPKNKKPIIEKGLLRASTDRNIVLQWWQMFPDANIGIATGVGFDVLDIDGPDAVPALLAILGADYKHAGPVVVTGKGKHLYFQPVETARNRAGLLGGKLDYRGAGGYVVGPPSVHPSGAVYQWDDGRDHRSPLPECPSALLEIILKQPAKEAPKRQYIGDDDGNVIAVPKQDKYAINRPNIREQVERLGGIVVQHGSLLATNCFFHDDPGPSMVLYEADNSFHCFGCEAHGDSDNLRMGKDMTGRKFR